ncbi:hypothetical protein A3J17_00825 [Candidatus Curtissbacteria bacterium RIFCSPLOWO2_02_FULL_40_11]|uniref:Mannose-6-phosphate isomerase type II C-terminal domain-containing protein n=2 Tax=Candidatus Curtissiibacteriota TaxID=1752717 RepID=A0A1F5GBN9_9BACT|nr:MAG: hypothetical protein A3D04_01300 [Candidatus Curtissbacteria bacterium RIFCSPHIGHO2_02_FULL_40_16b]OGD99331.1 MAG: hypothetical protein A3J17_00825 [Candidatus Curtissbacteria bacterium RIFCSPLOWO2_02_FULL_40_11]OGE13948.1 MAG: hypothetical protein A3G14_05005 [Candidatus Curtissbacteria bacterium RIFCSPLOWO2_12_FULL_38_9]
MIKKFENSPYARKIEKPWGWEIHWVPDDKPYMGKILHINAGARLSLQKHDKKVESWWLSTGRAMLIIENNKGELEEIEMKRDVGYSCNVNQKHRLKGITDCDIVEVSTAEIGTTFRLEDDYDRSGRNEDAKERELRNRGKA